MAGPNALGHPSGAGAPCSLNRRHLLATAAISAVIFLTLLSFAGRSAPFSASTISPTDHSVSSTVLDEQPVPTANIDKFAVAAANVARSGIQPVGYTSQQHYMSRAEIIVAEIWDQVRLGSVGERFSLVDWGSNAGYFSLLVARLFPTSVVLSLEGSYEKKGGSAEKLPIETHRDLARQHGLTNNHICNAYFGAKTFETMNTRKVRFDFQLLLSVIHWVYLWPEYNTELQSSLGKHGASASKSAWERNVCLWLSQAKVSFVEMVHPTLDATNIKTFPDHELWKWYAGRTDEAQILRETLASCGLHGTVRLVESPKTLGAATGRYGREARRMFLVDLPQLAASDVAQVTHQLQCDEMMAVIGCRECAGRAIEPTTSRALPASSPPPTSDDIALLRRATTRRSPSLTLSLPLQRAISLGCQRLSNQSHPFVRAALALKWTKRPTEEPAGAINVLSEFYNATQPATFREWLGLPAVVGPLPVEGPPYLVPWPWLNQTVEQRRKHVPMVTQVENARFKASNITLESGGHPHYGPCSNEKINLEAMRLAQVVESVLLGGFRQDWKADPAFGFILARHSADPDWRWQVNAGHHRSAVAQAFGVKNLETRILGVVLRDRVDTWPGVVRGIWTKEAAVQVLDRLLAV